MSVSNIQMAPAKVAVHEDPPSTALYISGLIIALCGIQAVNIARGDATFAAVSIALTVIGFVYSYGTRLLGLQAPLLQFICLVFVVAVLYNTTGQQLSLGVLVRAGEDKNSAEMAILLACAGVCWSWLLQTDNLVSFTCVLSLAMLGLVGSQDVNEQIIIYFSILIFCAVFLIVHQNFLQVRKTASALERAQPLGDSVRAQFILALICLVVVFTLATIVTIFAQIVFSRFSFVQAIKQIGALGSGKSAAQSAAEGLSFSDDDTMALGTGDGWTNDPNVLMHVVTSDGLPHYWRGRTYDLYNGDEWRSSLSGDSSELKSQPNNDSVDFALPPIADATPDPDTSAQRPLVRAAFDVRGATPEYYYTGLPTLLQTSVKQLGQPIMSPDGMIFTTSGEVSYSYTVTCQLAPDPTDPIVQQQLRRAGTDYPAPIRRYYMEPIVNDLTQESDMAYFRSVVKQATRGLSKNEQDPLDVAERIQSWVTARCVYSLVVPPIDPDSDHVRVFLQKTRAGYCDMFASSMAVLCRTAGLPVRLATGFAPGSGTSDNGFDIEGTDKHAWVEIFFPHYGWVVFDPTEGTRADSTISHAASARQLTLPDLLRRLYGTPVASVLTFGLLAIGLYLIKVELIDRYVFRRRISKDLTAVVKGAEDDDRQHALRRITFMRYRMLERSVSRIAGSRHISETVSEYTRRVSPAIAELVNDSDFECDVTLFERVTNDFVACRYGAGPLLPEAAGAGVDREIELFARLSRRHSWSRIWRRIFRATGTPKSAVPTQT